MQTTKLQQFKQLELDQKQEVIFKLCKKLQIKSPKHKKIYTEMSQNPKNPKFNNEFLDNTYQ